MAIFLVMMIPARRTDLQLPSRVGLEPSAPCPGAHVEVDPAICEAWEPEVPDHLPRGFLCDPKGLGDGDWRTKVTVRTGGASGCQYDLLVVDSPGADLTAASRRYRHVRKADEPNAYVVHGRPWRTYAAAPVWRSGGQRGFAGEMVLLGFYQRHGGNIRGSALIHFGAQLAAALVILLVIYKLVTRYWMRVGSWSAVALLSAAGGAVGGALFVLRPPDVGGYDEPIDPASGVLFAVVISGVIGITGCFFAWFRELLDRKPPGRRLLLTALVIPFVALVTAGLGAKWSASSRPVSADTALYVRTAYYLYFATSVALPLVLVQESGPHTGEAAEVRGRFWTRFGIAAFSSLFALLVGFTVSEMLEVATPGQLFRGFYKPAGGVGLWLVSLSIIAGLSLALAVGPQPRWIQDLNEDLSAFADAVGLQARLQYRQRILVTILARVDVLDAHAGHLAFVARQAPRVIRSLLAQESEIEQFAETLERSSGTSVHVDQVKQRLVAALEKLARIDPRESKIEVPLLLVDERTRELVQGKLGVTRFFDPGARRRVGVDVCHKGAPLGPESPLHRNVRTLVDLVNEDIVRTLRRDAFDQYRIEVDFQYEQDADLSGASYELPLALALVGLLVKNPLVQRTWAATGQIDRRTYRVDVADLEVKCAFLVDSESPRVLISAASAVGRCRAAASAVLCLDAEHDQEFEQIRRDVLGALTHGTSVLIGVGTMQQAIEILYGESVEGAKR